MKRQSVCLPFRLRLLHQLTESCQVPSANDRITDEAIQRHSRTSSRGYGTSSGRGSCSTLQAQHPALSHRLSIPLFDIDRDTVA